MIEAGQEPPASITEEPWWICRPFWDAFHVLHGRRQWTVGMTAMAQPLPYTEIAAYAKDHDLPLDDTVTLVTRMDTAYLQHVTDRMRQSHERGAG